MDPDDLSHLPTDTVIALAHASTPGPHRAALVAELRRREAAHTARASCVATEISKLSDEWLAIDQELDDLAAVLEGFRDE